MAHFQPEPAAALRTLLRVAELARRLPLPEALAEIARTLGESLGRRTVAIRLVRDAWDDLEVVAVHGDATWPAARLGETSSRSSWTARLDEHCRPPGAHHVALRDAREELLGVLSVEEPGVGREPIDFELDVLGAAAAHLATAVEQARAADYTRRLREGAGSLLSVSAELHAGRSTQEVLDSVCAGICRALNFRNVAALLAGEDGVMRAQASVGFEPGTGPLEAEFPLGAMEELLRPELQREGCVFLDAAAADALVPVDVPRAYRSTLNGVGARGWRNHWLMAPLTGEDGRVTGFIWADDPFDRLVPSRPRLQALRLFADLASGALEGAERLERMRRLAEHDPLTGLPNRRALDGFLARHDEAMALLVCDLDHFKRINDQLGHDAGDRALVAFAQILDGFARTSDLAVRLGGEEFALVLPGADSDAAFGVAERLLRATRERFAGLSPGLSVSIGIAAATDAESGRELLRRADRALLVAKRSGRDRAVVHRPETIGLLLSQLGEPAHGSAEQLGAVLLLAETLDLRDDATARHSRTVSRYAELAATRLGLPAHRVERLRIAGVLHDVGKVGVADAVLRKPEPLDVGEWREMQRHAELGARILSNAGLPDVAAWVLAHHERIDGGGYPAGLTGDQIPLEARVLAVVDAFEAMTADRPYHRALARDLAETELERCAGTQFDPVVVGAFLEALREEEAALAEA